MAWIDGMTGVAAYPILRPQERRYGARRRYGAK